MSDKQTSGEEGVDTAHCSSTSVFNCNSFNDLILIHFV